MKKLLSILIALTLLCPAPAALAEYDIAEPAPELTGDDADDMLDLLVFVDVFDGDPHAEAVRFAVGRGLMDQQSPGVFGTDAPATVGDMLAAANVLNGGERDDHEALAAFVEYGLVPNDTDLAAPLTPAGFWDFMSAMADGAVEPTVETADPEAVTRGELAEMLMAYVNGAQAEKR